MSMDIAGRIRMAFVKRSLDARLLQKQESLAHSVIREAFLQSLSGDLLSPRPFMAWAGVAV